MTGPKINDVPEYELEPYAGEQVGEAVDRLEFKFDGDTYVLRRPKMSIAIPLLNLATGTDSRTVMELGVDIVRLITGIISYIEEAPPAAVLGPDGEPTGDEKMQGQALLMHRLADPKDQLDILHLNRPFQDLMVRIFKGNPTGSRPESSKPRARTSRGGRAATRTRTPARTS